MLSSLGVVVAAVSVCFLASCQKPLPRNVDRVVISVKDQKMALVKNGKKLREYPVSTSKYGVGDALGSYRTPLGKMQVVSKIGAGQPEGMVFKSRQPTGEVISPNSPGRDPIVTRILWLNGLEAGNRNAFGRCIYIHGTPEERNIGIPASYGCIRMKSDDVTEIFDAVPRGAEVSVTLDSITRAVDQVASPAGVAAAAPVAAPAPVALSRPVEAAPQTTAAKRTTVASATKANAGKSASRTVATKKKSSAAVASRSRSATSAKSRTTASTQSRTGTVSRGVAKTSGSRKSSKSVVSSSSRKTSGKETSRTSSRKG